MCKFSPTFLAEKFMLFNLAFMQGGYVMSHYCNKTVIKASLLDRSDALRHVQLEEIRLWYIITQRSFLGDVRSFLAPLVRFCSKGGTEIFNKVLLRATDTHGVVNVCKLQWRKKWKEYFLACRGTCPLRTVGGEQRVKI